MNNRAYDLKVKAARGRGNLFQVNEQDQLRVQMKFNGTVECKKTPDLRTVERFCGWHNW